MNRKFIVYRSDHTDPYRNLAAEEYLTLHAHAGEPILFLWRNEGTVVIGKNQNSYAECNIDRMQKNGVLLSRRLSGGGAVFHDLGNLCFSFISHEDDHDVAAQLAIIAKACAEFGIDAKPTGRNDIETDGRKFSGNAFYTIGKNKCHHGTVLIASDIGKLSNYLTVSKTKLEAKGIKSVRSRVVNLSELNESITPSSFSDALIRVCGSTLCPMPSESLYSDRTVFFASDAWLYGENPEFSEEITCKTVEGEFTLHLDVKQGVVTDCRVFTDSLDTEAAEKISAKVVGKRFEEVQSTLLD